MVAEYFSEEATAEHKKKFGDQVQICVDALGEFTEGINPMVLTSAHASVLASLFHDGMKAGAFEHRIVKKMLVSLYQEAMKGPPGERH